MTEAAVTFLLNNVKDLITNYANLISRDKDELRKLEKDLSYMKAYLQDSSKRINKDEQFKQYERDIRNVVYEVEDALDSFITKVAAKKEKSILLRYFNADRLNLAKKVEYLRKEKIGAVFESVYHKFKDLPTTDASDYNANGTRGKREQDLRQENVVGLEEPTNTVIKYLLEESDKLDVISITGMPGIGKTTLAWKIHHDRRIQDEYQDKSSIIRWVYFSQDFNMKNVLLTILEKSTEQEMYTKTVDELTELVLKYLEKKKFLIFIDDVWTVDAWKEIQAFLPKSNKMGKVLMTSRSERVAWLADPKRGPQKLQLQDKNKSWELLQLEVFGKLGHCPPELEEVGKLIADDCEGNPLAIIVIGEILAEKYSRMKESTMNIEDEWKNVHESMNAYLYNKGEEKHIKRIVSLSYTSLSFDLRDCFLYLGIFPRDSMIPAWKLTQLWIAEGFIQQKSSDMSLEDIAHDNLEELIDWNLVIVDKRKPDGTVKTCRVHSIIGKFCRNKAEFEENNIFQEIRSKNGTFGPSLQKIQDYRRLCIHSYVKEFLLQNPKVAHTRSFFGFSKAPTKLEDYNISSITDTFDLLRVLDANTIRFPKFPSKLISKLIHLRYIILSGDKFKVLPKAMSNLCNIQTLIVDTLLPTLEIEADIWNMMQLKYFKTKASIILKNNTGKGKGGKNLLTLGRLSPESCTEDVFNKAQNLKTLGIRGRLASLSDSECLEKLKFLDKLKLVNGLSNKEPYGIPLERLPKKFPPHLRILTLSRTHLDWSHMSKTVGTIPNLRVLKLKDNAFMGNRWDAVGDQGFRSLKLLYIEGSNLKTWTASGDPFPSLKSIVLKNCQDLEEVPLKRIGKYIEMLSMELVTQSAIDSAKEIEMEKQKEQGQIKAGRNGFKLIIVSET